MRERILELLQQRPFQPFRIYLTNGLVHVVRHPEQIMVSQTYLIVGIPANDVPGQEISEAAFVSLVHVVQVEPFTPANTPSSQS